MFNFLKRKQKLFKIKKLPEETYTAVSQIENIVKKYYVKY